MSSDDEVDNPETTCYACRADDVETEEFNAGKEKKHLCQFCAVTIAASRIGYILATDHDRVVFDVAAIANQLLKAVKKEMADVRASHGGVPGPEVERRSSCDASRRCGDLPG